MAKARKNSPGLDVEFLKSVATAVANAVTEGYLPPGSKTAGLPGADTASGVVARQMGLSSSTMRYHLANCRRAGLDKIWLEAAAHVTSWKAPPQKQAGLSPEEAVQSQIQERRLRDEIRALKDKEREYINRIISLENIRENVMKLSAALEAPAIIPPTKRNSKGGNRTAILHISDVHAGEHVSLYEMDGLNSFDEHILVSRLERLFQKTVSLLTEHWSGDPVQELIICLGGDMIDNNLREESRRGGSMAVIPSVKLVSETLAGGFAFLRKHLPKVPIRVYTSPGNHGRLTLKPHIVEGNIDNLDILVSWGIEKILGHMPGVRFYYSGSGELLFNVYGWWFLLRHGHEGAGGTGGTYGPVYKQVRGMYKAHTSYGRRNRGFNWVLQGHDHTHVWIPFGFANGSVVGYNPYAMRKLQADPSPALQNLFIVEQQLGVIAMQPLYLGIPSEGSLYETPELDPNAIGKPVIRIKASQRNNL